MPTHPTRSVKPLPPSLCVDALLERKPVNLAARMVANDRDYREAERKALGGKIGTAVMVFVAVFLGVLLAAGGVL